MTIPFRRALEGLPEGLRVLWVDDSKPCPDCAAVARTYDDALRMLLRYDYDVLYLDHDLGDATGRTGYDLLKAMIVHNRVPPVVECISWNPVGKKRIEDLVRWYEANRAAMRPADL